MRVRACHMSVSVAALAGMLGCSDAIGPICTDEARPGILVTVRDSVMSAPVSGARVVARRGTTADTSSGLPDGTYPLAYEKPGTYEVTVEQTGYRLWTRRNLQVTRDECHVQTVSLTALVQPSGT